MGAPIVDILPKKKLVAGQTTVGTTAVAVTNEPHDIIVVKALAGNTGKVYVGPDANVTTSNGFELSAGDGVTLETSAPVYAIADAAGQGVCWIAMRRFAP